MWWNHHRNLHNKFPIGPLKLFTVKQSNCKSHQLVNICFVYGHKFHWTCMKCVDSAFSAKFNAILASCCNKQWPLCISLFSFHIYHPILPDGGFHPAACMLFEQSFSCTSIRYFFFIHGSSFHALYLSMKCITFFVLLECLVEWRITWQNILIFVQIQLRKRISVGNWVRPNGMFDGDADGS